MKEKIYGYDVYFRLKTPFPILVGAVNEEEAQTIAEEMLERMTKSEIIERIIAAMDFEPDFEVTYVDQVDELDEEDLK